MIAGQIFKQKYAPSYKFPLRITMILLAVAQVGFLLIRGSYMLLNRKRRRETAGWTEEQFAEEERNEDRRGDHKKTYIYGY